MRKIKGGIEVAGEVYSAGVSAGVKNQGKDLALIYFPKAATVAGVFTQNRVYGHHIKYCRELMNDYENFYAIVINSGNANALNGLEGYDDIGRIIRNLCQKLPIQPEQVLMASTGVIGERLKLMAMDEGFMQAISELSNEDSKAAAEAITTTDTVIKQVAYEGEIAGKTVRVGGMVKGTRMIHPNMGTMIGVITTNLALPQNVLQRQLIHAVDESFNKTSIDGNTSPNDTVFLCSTHEVELELSREVLHHFSDILTQVCRDLTGMIVADAENSTKTIEVQVNGALVKSDATKIAMEIATSSLVKSSLYENFPDTGRILAACGRNPDVTIIPHQIAVDIESSKGIVRICENGQNEMNNMKAAHDILDNKEVKISLYLNIGDYSSTVWTCDYETDRPLN